MPPTGTNRMSAAAAPILVPWRIIQRGNAASFFTLRDAFAETIFADGPRSVNGTRAAGSRERERVRMRMLNAPRGAGPERQVPAPAIP